MRARSRARARALCGCVALAIAWPFALGAAQDPPLRILIDQSPRAVEYQLSRLSNDELVRVERRLDDARYRPVFMAVLTRKGIARQYREEALAALTRLDQTGESVVLLEALGRIPDDDLATAAQVARLLVAQPAADLVLQRAILEHAATAQAPAPVAMGALAGILMGEPRSDLVWQFAEQQGTVGALLAALPLIPRERMADAGPALFARVRALVLQTPASPLRADALASVPWTARDRAAFELLASEVIAGSDDPSRASALRALPLLPRDAWTPELVEPLASAVIRLVTTRPSSERTEPAVVDAIHFGESLAGSLPAARGLLLARDLAALGVRVVRLEVVPDSLTYDRKYFVVEAGKPIQLVFANPDTMPHNVVIGRPGSVEAIGTAGGALPMPIDPNARAFVPDSPLVVASTNLVQPGETARLSFTAPREPGEFVYLCTFPGHWIRMYGVMLVVDNLEAWEASRIPPLDPVTKQRFN